MYIFVARVGANVLIVKSDSEQKGAASVMLGNAHLEFVTIQHRTRFQNMAP